MTGAVSDIGWMAALALLAAAVFLLFRRWRRSAFLQTHFAEKLAHDRRVIDNFYAALRELRAAIERILEGLGAQFTPAQLDEKVQKLEDAYALASLVLAGLDKEGEKLEGLSINLFAHSLKNGLANFAGLLQKMHFAGLPAATRLSLSDQFEPLRKKDRLLQAKLAEIQARLADSYARRL